MSPASLARQRARILRTVVPNEGQTLEEAQRDALLTHQVLNAKSAEVLVEVKLFFGNDDMKFARQNGRWFLMVKTITSKGGNAWRQLSVGRTPVEAFATARIMAENHQRELEAKKAAEASHPEPLPEAQPV